MGDDFKEADLISRVAPSGVAWADMEDIGQPAPLYPEEAACVAQAAEKRRREFSLGRLCARRALGKIGVTDQALLRADNGSPVWPAGIVGSITHTDGYAAALAAEQLRYRCVGVDAERIGRLTAELFPRLFTPPERAWLENFDSDRRGVLATIMFSAKEACYKAWAAGKTLSFLDFHIELAAENFIAARRDSPSGSWGPFLKGDFAVEGDLVVTSFCIPQSAGA